MDSLGLLGEKVPAWAKRLALAADYNASYEDIRDIYIYLRSTRNLIERSGLVEHLRPWEMVVQGFEYVFSSKGFADLYIVRELVEELERKGLGPEVSYFQKKIELNMLTIKKKETEEEKKAKEYLKSGASLNRAITWRWRLQNAITEAVGEGWYPLFGTYTVDPKRLPKGCLSRDDLWKTTPCWDRFVKKFKTEVAQACGYGRRPANWPEGKEFFQYFAVIEHGSGPKQDHPHVHVIWMCKEIPDIWKRDPNANSSTNTEVDIAAASALWPHGVQRKTMALFIVGSRFIDDLKWVVPRKSPEEPGKVGDAGSIAGYLAKYLTKGATKKWNHRVKATKNLGLLKLLKSLEEEKSLSLLLAMACRPMKHAVWMKLQAATSCPLSLLREKSRQELTRRLHFSKTPRAARFLQKEWTKRPPEFFTNLILSVKDGLRPWRMMQGERYKAYSQMLEEVAPTVHCKGRVAKLVQWLTAKEGHTESCQTFVLLKGEFAT